MTKGDRKARKSDYFSRVIQLLNDYDKLFVVNADNVGSNQMHKIRISLRGKAVLLMGKNTMMRKAIRSQIPTNPALERLLPHVKQNIGFVFTKDDLKDVRDKLLDNRVEAPARAGAIAPVDVYVEAQNTGMGPEKTSFFQALGIATKISKGTIEILNRVHLIKEGDKVGPSEATLLNMLKISPFTYGLIVNTIYDNGMTYPSSVLDITNEQLLEKISEAAGTIAAFCLAVKYPTKASVPHSLINGYKAILGIALATEYTFPGAEKAKEYLANPEAFAVAAPAAQEAPAEEKKEEKKVEEEEESDDDMGFGLFD